MSETRVIMGLLLLAALGVGVWLYVRKRRAASLTPTKEPRPTVVAPPAAGGVRPTAPVRT